MFVAVYLCNSILHAPSNSIKICLFKFFDFLVKKKDTPVAQNQHFGILLNVQLRFQAPFGGSKVRKREVQNVALGILS